jgi:hypothetical protein
MGSREQRSTDIGKILLIQDQRVSREIFQTVLFLLFAEMMFLLI